MARRVTRSIAAVAILSAGAMSPGLASAQDAEPCAPRRAPVPADDPPSDFTTFHLTTRQPELGPVVTEVDLLVTRHGPPEGAVGVFLESGDLSAVAGEHYVPVAEWVRWADGEIGEKTVVVQILDHDPAEPERAFTVAMDGLEPPTLGSRAIFEYDDQVNVYLPGTCPDEEPPPDTAAPETTVAPTTTIPLATDLPETGSSSGTLAVIAALALLAGGTMIATARRRPGVG